MNDLKYFVFDTNALISAHLLEGSTSALAFSKALSVGILVRSDATLIEFADRFLRSKFDKYLSREDRLQKIDEFKRNSLPVLVNWPLHVCRDPNDDMFLELAIAANASCIITGDLDLLVLHPFREIPVLSPADFLKYF